MDLQEFQEAVAAKIREIPLLAGLPVREEQLGNIIDTLQDDVLKAKFCIVVGTASFEDEAPDASACYGTTKAVISVFEDPEMNRREPGRPTFLSAAQAIAKALKLWRPRVPGAGALTSPRIGEAHDLGDGIVSVTVTLSMKTEL